MTTIQGPDRFGSGRGPPAPQRITCSPSGREAIGLEAAIRRNLWICRIAPLVAELLREEGFLPRHGDAVAEAVYGIMDRFHCNGFDFAMDDAHLTRDVARKIAAAILREGYWKI